MHQHPPDLAVTDTLPLKGLGTVVLAGGLARRMGGDDKGLVPFAGAPMIASVLGVVATVSERVLINANRNRERYLSIASDLSCDAGMRFAPPVVVTDRESDFQGPLAGLSAGMAALETPYVFMCPCDSPFIVRALPERLYRALLDSDADIAVPVDSERRQPAFLLVRRGVRASLDAFLHAGERKIDRWFANESTVDVPAADLASAFRNINTREELAAAERDVFKDSTP